jgi:hypothetical protein
MARSTGVRKFHTGPGGFLFPKPDRQAMKKIEASNLL